MRELRIPAPRPDAPGTADAPDGEAAALQLDCYHMPAAAAKTYTWVILSR